MSKLLIGGFMGGVVALECLIAYLVFPSPEDVAAHSWGTAMVALVLVEMSGVELDRGRGEEALELVRPRLHDAASARAARSSFWVSRARSLRSSPDAETTTRSSPLSLISTSPAWIREWQLGQTITRLAASSAPPSESGWTWCA